MDRREFLGLIGGMTGACVVGCTPPEPVLVDNDGYPYVPPVAGFGALEIMRLESLIITRTALDAHVFDMSFFTNQRSNTVSGAITRMRLVAVHSPLSGRTNHLQFGSFAFQGANSNLMRLQECRLARLTHRPTAYAVASNLNGRQDVQMLEQQAPDIVAVTYRDAFFNRPLPAGAAMQEAVTTVLERFQQNPVSVYVTYDDDRTGSPTNSPLRTIYQPGGDTQREAVLRPF